MNSDFSESVDVVFHGVSYLCTISTVNGDTMCVEVEQKSDASRWRGDFTSRYIEDITSKTGNFKKFHVFVKMLLSAVKQASDSVFVDLLTYQDLEVLKSRKAGSTAAPPPTQPSKPLAASNKRYLILTYAAEFDRVHYPLPLLYDDNPDPEYLKGIISSLRAELAGLQQDAAGSRRAPGADMSADMRRLREENTALRQQLKQLDRAVRADLPDNDRATAEARELARELKHVRKERDLLQARMEAAEAEAERERGQHRRELRRKAKEAQEAYDELPRLREEVRALQLQVRHLLEELESLTSRRGASAASVERMQATYQQSRSSNSRPGSSGRGPPRPSSTSHAPGLPRSHDRPRDRDSSRGRETSSRERERLGFNGSGGGRSGSRQGPAPHEPPARRPLSSSSSPSASRPNSAPVARPQLPTPAAGRFNPTEYVRGKQSRERDQWERRGSGPGSAASSRAPTPPRSQPTSGRASPQYPARQGSLERGSRAPGPGSQAGYSPAGSRASSVERGRQQQGAGGAAWPERVSRPLARGGEAYPGSRGSSPGSLSGARGGQAAWAGGQAWSKFPPLQGASNGNPPGATRGSGSRPQSAERLASPGRALQEVKKKLSEYVTKRSTDETGTGTASATIITTSRPVSSLPHVEAAPLASTQGPTAERSLPRTSSKGQIFDDASAEIADIDSRLHALQSFLRMAKSSAATSQASGKAA
ncbi:protein required for templated centriole assembly [Haematococcus lacustris]